MNLLNEVFLLIATKFVDFVTFFYSLIARFFGYPNNPGMAAVKPKALTTFFETSKYPKYVPDLDLSSFPLKWSETILFKIPQLSKIPRFFYLSKDDGFYSFSRAEDLFK